MLVFLDTEYTDFIDCDLISIGLVSEDGQHELYLERSDYERAWCNDFVRAAVLPLLTGPAVDQAQLAARLSTWFASLPGNVTVASDSFSDWELLLDALGQRPANLVGHFDLRAAEASEAFNHAACRYHEQGNPWHHALHDAKAHRAGWLAMSYRYVIETRPANLGGGWRLRLLQDGEEVGGGVFPPEDGSQTPDEALQAAYDDAEATALDWLESRVR